MNGDTKRLFTYGPIVEYNIMALEFDVTLLQNSHRASSEGIYYTLHGALPFLGGFYLLINYKEVLEDMNNNNNNNNHER